ncbi:hypothetical protein TWF569_009734 [Orbilia oligospora]|uniref:Rhodopsin domain-containing protein n=2 Tax=Orbilia oligospora TaxID=2813651 RepID=A0A7C8P0J4_ORBOL|nr:hypothetical protein TWF102_009554 [Orbilia oligospora]KAF3093478.1 hypothetical protein TWF706_008721 [Orbilia oligospora]KAF3102494.1 hypothetical protein TWF103_007663 [Orbilia oligospora]KAF3139541.1 hypothetical protein TWF703_003730 [Orbilia oligospora]KAF3141104.1 hypothetical protein TWF594_006142 [Orbilia oligospora]
MIGPTSTIVLAPPAVVQAWPPANTINPENQGWKLVAWEIPLLSITIFIVGLRIYAKRMYTKHGLGREDWLIITSTFLTAVLITLQCLSTSFGWGIHLWDFAPLADKFLEPARKLAFSMEIVFTVSINLTKLSILTFYLRLFPLGVVSVHLHRLIYAGMAITVLAMLATLVAAIFQCHPIEHFWIYNMEGHCYPTYPAHLATAIINSVTDFYCVIVPLGEICGLTRVDRRGKWIVVSCFALGAIVCFAGVIRIYFTKLVFHDSPYDWTWDSIGLYIASALECTLGIVCASVPALRPLFTKTNVRAVGDLESDLHKKRRSAARRKRRTGAEAPAPLEFVTTAFKERDADSVTPLTSGSENWKDVKLSDSPHYSNGRRSTKWPHWV